MRGNDGHHGLTDQQKWGMKIPPYSLRGLEMEIIVRSKFKPKYVIGNGDEGRGLYLEHDDGYDLIISDVLDDEAIEIYVDEAEETSRVLMAEFMAENESWEKANSPF